MSASVTVRNWGQYRVLGEVGKEVKVKELIVAPYSSLSMQKHEKRNEFWFVAKGYGILKGWGTMPRELNLHEHAIIETNEWHQLVNPTEDILHIIEIQYGEECIEEDITRK